MKSSWFGWLPRFVVFALALVLVQDIVIVIFEHRQFASSIVCSDPSLHSLAGRYLSVHCIEHSALGDWRRLSSWLAAVSDIPWQRLVAVGGALILSWA